MKKYLLTTILCTAVMVGCSTTTNSGTHISENYDHLSDSTVSNINNDGSTNLAAFMLPQSSALTLESRRIIRNNRDKGMLGFQQFVAILNKDCPVLLGDAPLEDLPAIRRCRADAYAKTDEFKRSLVRWPAKTYSQDYGGVYTDVFMPKEGVAQKNKNRILIFIHGGGFEYGAFWQGTGGAGSIAVDGKFKVVSVEYRQWPEARYPSAEEDVTTVYKELLKEYKPENIGIYGCSAGGTITGTTTARIAREKLPRPGAIGIFGAGMALGTDSLYIGSAIMGTPFVDTNFKTLEKIGPRFKYHDNLNDVQAYGPETFPGDYLDVLANFPPSLLITASRDYTASTILLTHTNMIKAGVDADLHVWEGLGHCFHRNSQLSEADDARKVIIDFFDKHLGD